MSRKSTKAPKERTLTDAQGREISVKVLNQDIIEREAAIKHIYNKRCLLMLNENSTLGCYMLNEIAL